jgi:hypothetical protein
LDHNLALSRYRNMFDADPSLLPCDAKTAGALLGQLAAMGAILDAESATEVVEAEQAKDVLRKALADGLRSAMRGGNGNGNGNGNGDADGAP